MFAVTPNLFAYVSILAWFPITVLLFAVTRPSVATAISMIGAATLLPQLVSFDLPLFPAIDKRTVPIVASFLCLLLWHRGKLRSARPLSGIDRWFLVLVASFGLTVVTNPDPAGFGKAAERGLDAYDYLYSAVHDVVLVFLPFLIGRTVYRDSRSVRDLLVVLAAAGLLLVLPALWEIRMTPQLHRQIYGFIPTDFRQQIRGQGFRPMVFMGHGLSFARFMFAACVATAILARMRQRILKAPALPLCALLFAVVIACKSTGAIYLSLVTLPLVFFAKPRLQARVGVLLAACVLAYPALRAIDLVPTEALVSLGRLYSEERAESLQARFDQEDMLTVHAAERLLFGWGPYSRSHVVDPVTGEDVTIVDGEWLIVFGVRGLVGFFAWFILYVGAVFLTHRRFRLVKNPGPRQLLGGLSLLMAILTVDMIPNSTGAVPHFFFAGALAGAARGIPMRTLLSARQRRSALAEHAASSTRNSAA